MFKLKYPAEVYQFVKDNPDKNGKVLSQEIEKKFGIKIHHNYCYKLHEHYVLGKKYTHGKCIPSWLLKPLGSERLDKDGYVKVRVEGGEKLKHRIVWEHNYGEVKPNEVIMFKDGNRTNCDISNLMKVERKYLGATNQLMKDKPKEFLETAVNVAKVLVEARDKWFLIRKNDPKCKPKKDKYSDVVRLWEEGLLPYEIAEKLKVHLSGVRWMLRKHRAVNEKENIR